MTRGWTRAPTDRERKTCGPSVKICRVGALPGEIRPARKLARLRTRTCGEFKGGLRGRRRDSFPSPTRGEGTKKALRRRVGETVRLELVAQRGLQDLARGGVRNAVDERDVIGHPPFGDLAVHEFQNVLARPARTLLELDDQQR